MRKKKKKVGRVGFANAKTAGMKKRKFDMAGCAR